MITSSSTSCHRKPPSSLFCDFPLPQKLLPGPTPGKKKTLQLFTNGQEQPITNVTQARLKHPTVRQLGINTRKPDLGALGPHLGSSADSRDSTQHREHDDSLSTPLTQRLDGSGAGTTRGDDGVEHDGEAGGSSGVVDTCARPGGVVGQVVVVLDGAEGGGLAEETEVVDGDGLGEDGLDG